MSGPEQREDMGEQSDSISAIWEEIELSESYLVSSLYEKAASLASSIIKGIRNNGNVAFQAMDSLEMMESAGMVLVQSLSQLGRAQEILKELKLLFVSAEAIPVQVLITGACFQISEGLCLDVKECLEEFLEKWRYVDGRYYALISSKEGIDKQEVCDGRYVLGVDEYIEVVEVYAVTLLGTTLKDLDTAISWVEKAALPEERRQVILRRLQSLSSLKASNLSRGSSMLAEHNHESHYSSSEELSVSEASSKALKASYQPHVDNDMKHSIIKFSSQIDPCFWWFRSVNLKLGNARLAITNGKIVLGCLVILVYFVLRKKGTALKGIVMRQILSMKKSLVDMWQLAFSYQVNPLAAVQSLPTATHGSH